MDAKSKGNSILPAPYEPQSGVRARSSPFRYLALLVSAAVLSTILQVPSLRMHSFKTVSLSQAGAIEWKDDEFPLREQTPWDISTDYQYPRVLEYDVTEGTWLRLDVHPTSGDIVFDMLGDLYCLSRAEVSAASGVAVTAHPILLGVPHDSDAHFSPTGDRIVFRSDAGLGVENIWVKPWAGCAAADLRAFGSDPALTRALQDKNRDEELLAQGVKETKQRRLNRLLREGRSDAQRVTNETYRWISDARFHPSGSEIIATKWYTTSRSLGAGEGWRFPVPEAGDNSTIKVGSGARVLGRTLPRGESPQMYGEVQVGPEQFIWRGEDGVIFSKNGIDGDQYTYSKDVHKGIYSIFSHNITTGKTETLVSSSPGGASRPQLSRDQRTLAFVRRERDHELLVFKDLETGSVHHIWDGLSYDLGVISAPMGTYASFSFTPSDDAVIIWAGGQIYTVPITKNSLGERVANKAHPPTPIPFRAHIEKRLANTLSGSFDLIGVETAPTQRVTSFRNVRADAAGSRVVFDAGAVSYVQGVGKSHAKPVPVLHPGAPYYSPAWVPGSPDAVIHARWSNTNFTSFEIADLTSGKAYELSGLPFGRYFSPAVSEGRNTIAFLKSAGDDQTGHILATAKPGLYLADLTLGENPELKNVHFVSSEISVNDMVNMRFLDNNGTLLVQQSDRSFVIDLAAGPSGIEGKYPHHTVATGRMSSEIATSLPKKTKKGYAPRGVAFIESFNVYYVPGDGLKEDEAVWSKPGNATKNLVRVSLDGGAGVTWSDDGKKLLWFLGPHLHSLEVSKLDKCSSAIESDPLTFGISCVKGLLEYQEVVIEHSTDIARLKKEAAQSDAQGINSDVFVIFNATILTMETGDLSKDLIRDGVVTIRGGVIESVGPAGSFVASGATAIDAHGGYVIPGFIDVHAHWNNFDSIFPATSWELQAFLAYGVTTLHNPSASDDSFAERSRVESGLTVGSRIFSTGAVIYGAAAPSLHQSIADEAEAYSALVRLRAAGGIGSISYKNYNLPIRASRQRLLNAGRKINMLCVPEGGMNFDWDLTYIVDGMTTVEHALPVPQLFDDVLTLFALSGTAYTPTHIVNYGGAWGEQLVWATQDVPNDHKLRAFVPHAKLDVLSESTSRPMNSYQFFNTSASSAKMVHMGLRSHIGAHGEPPYGVNYHAELAFAQAGGLSNYETLQSATSLAAVTLGLFDSLGSVSVGKLADLVVYPPGVDLLHGDISQSVNLSMVARGGRFWDASTMTEIWPVKGKQQVLPPLNAV
ncbi:unnamed protein product [Mycena citricolor]|uniref:Amidohydrolase-related domain-containing protein n=1 Tax=Mycena citricolor TaxID=2018698 RepID=A0AAD2HYU3_9AGAR|nr:unnamed protein product [Mycena citricolor]